jgi:hypothetical protein
MPTEYSIVIIKKRVRRLYFYPKSFACCSAYHLLLPPFDPPHPPPRALITLGMASTEQSRTSKNPKQVGYDKTDIIHFILQTFCAATNSLLLICSIVVPKSLKCCWPFQRLESWPKNFSFFCPQSVSNQS